MALDRLVDLGIIDGAKGLAGLASRDGHERGMGVAAVPREPALKPALDLLTPLGRDPAALDEDAGQRGVPAQHPEGARVGELLGVDQFVLESKYAAKRRLQSAATSDMAGAPGRVRGAVTPR